jgi:hypothetical protein
MKGKDLFYSFPNITISADCPSADKGPGAARQPKKDDGLIYYMCPLYKYPVRQDRYLITNSISLQAEPKQELKRGKGGDN